MDKKNIITIILAVVITAGVVESRHFFYNSERHDHEISVSEDISDEDTTITSPYSGQETRWIKSLSQDDIQSLQEGSGVALGGMAKLAELNGYPGPRHVLEMSEKIGLTGTQQEQIETMFDVMKAEAILLGEQIIEIEREIDTAFADKTITQEILQTKLNESADFYGELRFIHLKYHFMTIDILTPEQVAQYNELRGYTSDTDPCENIPEGHDPELWKSHNNCS